MSDTCSICQDTFKNPKLLICGHTFCRKCIDDIIKSQQEKDIKCPLCRKITNRPNNGARNLVDNYFVTDRRYTTQILRCKECNKISKNKCCKCCGKYLCDKCIFSHTEKHITMEERKRQCDPTKHLERPLHGVGLCEIEEMSEAYRSKFSFELVKRIVVPNLFWNENEHEININISSISCFDGKNCIVAPNGDELVLIYDKDGNEMLRDIIHFRVVDIAMGLKGYPLIIENGTSTIYEYRFGANRKLFRSQPLLPYAISSLNDGKVVLVGTVSTRTLLEAEFQRRGAMRVYKYNGQIVSEALREHEEYLFDFPFHVCVSLENNDIYVGDINKKKIMHFKEDCTFISSYTASEMRDAYMLVGGISVENTHFPLSLTYIQTSKLLLASYHSGFGGGRIHVLSPNLEFLGLFHADQDVGVPVGMSIDDDGNVFFGDNSDGIIRVFKLSEYVNNL